MFQTTSEQSGRRSLLIAWKEIVNHGWSVMEADRDCVFDLAAWMGVDRSSLKPTNLFETIQVKTLQKNRLTIIVDRSGEVVCKGGKTRNTISYADAGIDWLIGVDREGEKCHFYPWDFYSGVETKSFSVDKYPSFTFPFHNPPSNHKK